MKKRKLLKIILISLVLIIGLFFYSEKVNKIEIIENVKNAISNQMTEQIENTANALSETEEPTVIDVTNLEDNGNLEHEHLYKTIYDENKHWNECTVCGEKLNENVHSYTSSWTMGSSNVCNENNVNKFVCTCGYSYESTNGRKGHIYNNWINIESYCGANYCKNCPYYTNYHGCQLSNGTKINCTNRGVCSICGTNYWNYSPQHYKYNNNRNSDMYCHWNCSTYLGIVNKCELVKKSTNVYELHTNITVPSGAVFSHFINENYFSEDTVKLINSNTVTSGTTWSAITTITFTEHTETKSWVDIGYVYSLNGQIYKIWCDTDRFGLDTEVPTIEIEKNKALCKLQNIGESYYV